MNSRFANALHVLVLIADSGDEPMSSETIATSVGTNAVVIRRMFRTLDEAALIVVRPGVRGGAVLARPAAQISLAELYRAVESAPALRCSGEPEEDCALRSRVRSLTAQLAQRVDRAIARELGALTLADVAREVGERPHARAG